VKNTILVLMGKEYPSFIIPESKPFDPLEISLQTEAIVSKSKSRKYTDFYCTGVYGGISTGYTVGCCLRCDPYQTTLRRLEKAGFKIW